MFFGGFERCGSLRLRSGYTPRGEPKFFDFSYMVRRAGLSTYWGSTPIGFRFRLKRLIGILNRASNLARKRPTLPPTQNLASLNLCLYCTKLEPIFKINSRYIPQGKALTREYARALAKRESGNVLPDERLKWEEMSRSRKNGLGFAKQFCGREDSQNRD